MGTLLAPPSGDARLAAPRGVGCVLARLEAPPRTGVHLYAIESATRVTNASNRPIQVVIKAPFHKAAQCETSLLDPGASFVVNHACFAGICQLPDDRSNAAVAALFASLPNNPDGTPAAFDTLPAFRYPPGAARRIAARVAYAQEARAKWAARLMQTRAR